MTADDLLTALKDSAAIPPAGVTLTDAKLLTAINETMQSVIAPWLVAARGGFLLDFADSPLVGGTAGYDVPVRALAGAVERISYVDGSGNDNGELSTLTVSDLDHYSATGDPPDGYYFQEGQIVVVPTPSSPTGSLRVYYHRRPGDLITGAANYATLTSNSATVLTCAAVNTTTFAIGATVDITQAKAPYRVLAKDLAITASTGTTITIGAGGLTAYGLAAGNYVTLARTSYVPQIPQEWQPVLEMASVARVQRQIGDMQGYAATMQAAEGMRKTVLGVSTPRAAQNPKVISAWGRR